MPPTNGLHRALWVLFAVNILNFYDRHVAGALAEPTRKEFLLSDAEIGFLGTAFTWLYAIIGVPLGRKADRGSRKRLLAGGVLVWSFMTAFAGAASNYTMLLLSRLGVAVGEASCAPSATSWLGDLFPANRRSKALAIFMLGVPVGAALSYFFSGPIAEAFGWRMAMVVAAVPGLLLLPVLFTLPEPARGASEEGGHAETATGSVWSILRIPTLWWIIASGALLNFNMYAIATFLPAFLSRIHKLSLAQSGIATGVAYLIGGVGGGLMAGWIGDIVVRKRKDGRLLVGALFALLTAPLAFFGIGQPVGSLALALPLLALAYAGCNSYYGLVYPSIQDIVPPSLRATTMSVYFMAMYLLGASLGPWLTGKLSDSMARKAMQEAGAVVMTEQFKAVGLQQAMYVIPALAVGLAVVLFGASRTIAKDIARREENRAQMAATPAQA